ncbi:MAG TPA: hypothetical protein EYP35_08345, partial [Desulfobacterales bacterium]|nr:hypothetical protein [Desulfobacterales bacterium]
MSLFTDDEDTTLVDEVPSCFELMDYEYIPVNVEDIQEMHLLPHQLEFMQDTKTKILGIVSGYGGGKTYIAARKLLHLALLNPGTDLIATEPNFPLLIQILIPEVHSALREFGLSYKFKATEQTFYVHINGETNRLICKSMENYDRLIGINASGIVLDEFDTTK